MTPRVGAVCVDASIVLKLLIPEADGDVAHRLWSRWRDAGTVTYAPLIILWEVANGVRKAVRSGELTGEEADTAIAVLLGLGLTFVDFTGPEFASMWTGLVSRYDHLVSPYDASYLAVAQSQGCEFWTADARLARTVGDQAQWVRVLEEADTAS